MYYYGGQKGSGALTWLEQHTGISMRSLWSLKFIKMILPSCAMAVLLLVWLSTCVVQVETYQQGALYRFGQSGAGGYPGARPALQASGAL